jgi:sorting nexin-1/2
MAFSSRIRMYYAWQTSEADARRARQNHERNRAQGKIAQDRLPHALNFVADVRVVPLHLPLSRFRYRKLT